LAYRTPLKDRTLPDYTRGEEIFNMVSHTVGGGFAIAALLACLCVGAWQHSIWAVICSLIYGAAMINLYAMSSIYHGLKPENPKKVFQVIDHCAIYFLIAGTYTPITLVTLRPIYPGLAWGITVFVWICCFAGAALTAIDLHKFMVISMILYIGMGWSVVVFAKQVLEAVPSDAFVWLIAGGVAYTIGSVLYGIGKKRRYMHSLFHLFVLAGSILHFVCILLLFLRIPTA
jgi:hemolysin III